MKSLIGFKIESVSDQLWLLGISLLPFTVGIDMIRTGRGNPAGFLLMLAGGAFSCFLVARRGPCRGRHELSAFICIAAYWIPIVALAMMAVLAVLAGEILEALSLAAVALLYFSIIRDGVQTLLVRSGFARWSFRRRMGDR